MAKDFLGQELQVGDKVVCLRKGYRGLAKAKIVDIMPVMIAANYTVTGDQYITHPCNVVKIQEVKE